MSDDSAKFRDIAIVRDNGYFRAAADNAIVLHLGRDVEVCFVATHPTPILNRETVDDEDDGEENKLTGIQIENKLLEVGRVRMAPEAWAITAVQIVARQIEEGLISLEDFGKNVDFVVRERLNENVFEK